MNNIDSTKKQDWLGLTIANPEITYDELNFHGITDENVELKSKDQYKSDSRVIDMFTKNGTFDDKAFDNAYNYALKSFNSMSNGQTEDFKSFELGNNLYSPLRIKGGNRESDFKFEKNINPFLESKGIEGSIFSTKNKNVTAYELAQSNKIWDSNAEKWIEETPEERGFFGTAIKDTLVFATYNEDGYHEDSNGRRIKHYKGQYREDENNKPFYETLKKGENVRGKRVLSSFDVITREGTFMNKLDFLDNDGKDKSIAGTVAQAIATVAPAFIPYVGQAYIAGIVLKNGLDLGITLTKMLDTVGDVFEGSKDFGDKRYNVLDPLQGLLRKFNVNVSEKSEQDMFTFENMGNLISDVALQWGQMRFLAKVPKQLGFANSDRAIYKKISEKYGDEVVKEIFDGNIIKNKNLYNTLLATNPEISGVIQKTLKRSALYGKGLSLGYMAGISTHDTYEDALNSGYDRRAASLTAAISMAATYWMMMKFDIGSHALKGLGIDDERFAIREASRAFIQESKEKMLNITASNIPEAAKSSAIKSLMYSAKKHWSKASDLILKGGYSGHSLAEGVEEMSEEAIMDLSKEFMDLATFLTGTQKNGSFKFLESNPFERYMMSAIGGGIGGATFHLAGKIEGIHNNMPENDKRYIYYLLANGKKEEVKREFERFRKEGVASKTLSMETDEMIDGVNQYKPLNQTSSGISQNDAVINMSESLIEVYDNIINQEGLNISDDELVNLSILRDKRIQDLIAFDGRYEMINDFNKITKDMMDLLVKKKEIELANTSSTGKPLNNTSSNELIQIDQKLNELREEKNKILTGANAELYLSKALFSLNSSISEPLYNANIFVYTKNIHNKDFNSLSDPEKEIIKSEYKIYKSKSKERISQAHKIFTDILKEKGKKISDLSITHAQLADLSEFINTNNPDDLFAFEDTAIENQNMLKSARKTLGLQQTPIDMGINITSDSINLSPEDKTYLTDRLSTNPLVSDFFNKVLSNSNTPADIFTKHTTEAEIKSYVDGLGLSESDANTLINNLIADIIKLQSAMENLVLFKMADRLTQTGGIITHDLKNKLLERLVGGSNISADPKSVAEEEVKFDDDTYLNIDGGKVTNESGNDSEEIIKFIDEINSDIANVDSYEKLKEFKKKYSSRINDNIINELFGISSLVDMDLMDKIQSIKAVNNPMMDVLSEFMSEITESNTPVNIFDLLEAQKDRYNTSERVEDFVLSGTIERNQLIEAKNVIGILNSVIEAMSDDSVIREYGYSSVLNKLRKSIGDSNLLDVINSDNAWVMKQELERLNDQIDFFLKLSEMNAGNQLKEHRMVAQVSQQNILKALLDEKYFASEITEDAIKYANESGLADLATKQDLTDEEFVKLENGMSNIEDILYDSVARIPGSMDKIKESFKASGFKFEDVMNPYFKKNELSQYNTTANPALFYSWIFTSVAIKSSDFNMVLKTKIENDLANNPDKLLIPLYAQQVAVRTGLAMALNPEVMNLMFDAWDKNPDFEAAYELLNIIYTNGGPGVGKTKGVSKYIYDLLKIVDSEKYGNVIISGPGYEQVANLASTLLEEDITDKTIFKDYNNNGNSVLLNKGMLLTSIETSEAKDAVRGYDVAKKKGNINSLNVAGLEVSKTKSGDATGVVFDDNLKDNLIVENDPYPDKNIIFIDEATYFNRLELKILSDYAVKFGKVIMMVGDTHQSGQTAYGFDDNISLYLFKIQTPALTSSLRVTNVHKKNNLDKFRARIDSLNEATNTNDPELLKIFNYDLSLDYYEDEKSLYGERIVNFDKDNVITKAKKLLDDSNGEKVGFIYDNNTSDTYKILMDLNSSEEYKNRIKFMSVLEAQGSEAKYFIVDIDLDTNNNRKLLSTAKNIYTAISRSKEGTLIINRGSSIINIDKGFTQDTEINSEAALAFTKLKLESLKKSTLGDGSSLGMNYVQQPVNQPVQPINQPVQPVQPVQPGKITPKPVQQPGSNVTKTDPSMDGMNVIIDQEDEGTSKDESGYLMLKSFKSNYNIKKIISRNEVKYEMEFKFETASIISNPNSDVSKFISKYKIPIVGVGKYNDKGIQLTRDQLTKMIEEVYEPRNKIYNGKIDELKRKDPYKNLEFRLVSRMYQGGIMLELIASNDQIEIPLGMISSDINKMPQDAKAKFQSVIDAQIKAKNTPLYHTISGIDSSSFGNCEIYKGRDAGYADLTEASLMNPGITFSDALVLTESVAKDLDLSNKDPYDTTPVGKAVVFASASKELIIKKGNKSTIYAKENFHKYYKLQLEEQAKVKNGEMDANDRVTQDRVRMIMLNSYGANIQQFMNKFESLIGKVKNNPKTAKVLKSYTGDYTALKILLALDEYVSANMNNTNNGAKYNTISKVRNLLLKIALKDVNDSAPYDPNKKLQDYFERLSNNFNGSDIGINEYGKINGNYILFYLNKIIKGESFSYKVGEDIFYIKPSRSLGTEVGNVLGYINEILTGKDLSGNTVTTNHKIHFPNGIFTYPIIHDTNKSSKSGDFVYTMINEPATYYLDARVQTPVTKINLSNIQVTGTFNSNAAVNQNNEDKKKQEEAKRLLAKQKEVYELLYGDKGIIKQIINEIDTRFPSIGIDKKIDLNEFIANNTDEYFLNDPKLIIDKVINKISTKVNSYLSSGIKTDSYEYYASDTYIDSINITYDETNNTSLINYNTKQLPGLEIQNNNVTLFLNRFGLDENTLKPIKGELLPIIQSLEKIVTDTNQLQQLIQYLSGDIQITLEVVGILKSNPNILDSIKSIMKIKNNYNLC